MRTGKSLSVASADLRRLQALTQDRDAPQKHVWRHEIELCWKLGDGVRKAA